MRRERGGAVPDRDSGRGAFPRTFFLGRGRWRRGRRVGASAPAVVIRKLRLVRVGRRRRGRVAAEHAQRLVTGARLVVLGGVILEGVMRERDRPGRRSGGLSAGGGSRSGGRQMNGAGGRTAAGGGGGCFSGGGKGRSIGSSGTGRDGSVGSGCVCSSSRRGAGGVGLDIYAAADGKKEVGRWRGPELASKDLFATENIVG